MKPVAVIRVGAVALVAIGALARPAEAANVPVFFNFLVDTATVGSLLHGGDTLLVDTLVTTEVGPLQQSVTFAVGSASRVSAARRRGRSARPRETVRASSASTSISSTRRKRWSRPTPSPGR
jgi:hypothetical protein